MQGELGLVDSLEACQVFSQKTNLTNARCDGCDRFLLKCTELCLRRVFLFFSLLSVVFSHAKEMTQELDFGALESQHFWLGE